jgi:hypothetical protein
MTLLPRITMGSSCGERASWARYNPSPLFLISLLIVAAKSDWKKEVKRHLEDAHRLLLLLEEMEILPRHLALCAGEHDNVRPLVVGVSRLISYSTVVESPEGSVPKSFVGNGDLGSRLRREVRLAIGSHQLVSGCPLKAKAS